MPRGSPPTQQIPDVAPLGPGKAQSRDRAHSVSNTMLRTLKDPGGGLSHGKKQVLGVRQFWVQSQRPCVTWEVSCWESVSSSVKWEPLRVLCRAMLNPLQDGRQGEEAGARGTLSEWTSARALCHVY